MYLLKQFGWSTAALALILLFAMNAHAVMYKWTDADGNVNYSQNPPPDGTATETIKAPPGVDTDGATKNLKNLEEGLDEVREERDTKAAEKKKANQEKAEMMAKCEQARARLASVQRPRVSDVDEQGNRTRLNEEQRQKAIKSANERVSEYCK